MPISPQDARKFATQTSELISQIDKAIIDLYLKTPTANEVKVEIPNAVYTSETTKQYLSAAYSRVGWEVSFDYQDCASEAERQKYGQDAYTYYFILLRDKSNGNRSR